MKMSDETIRALRIKCGYDEEYDEPEPCVVCGRWFEQEELSAEGLCIECEEGEEE